MDVAELLDIALAGIDDRRVEVATLEQAEISMEAVSGVAQLLAELIENAVAFSDPGDRVRITGLFTRDDYLITVSDHGVGIPEPMIAAINRQLEDPGTAAVGAPRMGIQLVARLAGRHGIGVRLVPAVPGTTARVTIPSRLVSSGEGEVSMHSDGVAHVDPGPGIFNPLRPRPGGPVSGRAAVPAVGSPSPDEPTLDLTRYESRLRSLGHVVAMTDSARADAEEFLAHVFGPLLTKPRGSERPTTRADRGGNENGPLRQAPRPDRGERIATTTALRVRVPGENFENISDEPSVAAAEAAIDIRSALTRYQQGRRSAEEEGT